MAGKSAEERINDLIGRVENSTLREVLVICEKRRKYPKDCITDGSLECFVKEILRLEETARAARGLPGPTKSGDAMKLAASDMAASDMAARGRA